MPRKPAPALIGGPYKPPPSEIGYFRGQAISGDTGISGDTILNPLSSCKWCPAKICPCIPAIVYQELAARPC